jgi:branched-chain amino acid transport system substrate-binding protein
MPSATKPKRCTLTRRLFTLGAVTAGVAVLACGGCRRGNENEILVGAYLSLSGADSTFGTDTRDGIELAVEETNAAGGIKGKKVRVLYEDDKSLTLEASQKVLQLIDRDKVVALLGEVASTRSLVGGLIANTRKVPMVTPSSTAVEVTKGREWVFRTCFTDEQQGAVAARFVKNELKKSRMGVFYAAQDTYSSGLARSFREEFKRLGGEIVVNKGYQKGETNFRTYLSELKAANPDAIFVPNYYTEMVVIARQAKEVGLSGESFIGGDGWDSANLVEGAGAELEGAYFTNHYAPDVPWENSKKFFTAFTASYRREPTSLAAQGYDAARLLFDAIERAPEISRDAIRRALAETKDFKGATGTMTIDKDRNANKPIVVVQVKDKKFKYTTQLMAD